MLHGRPSIAVTYFVFDVLAVDGLFTAMQPYSERRALLEQRELETERVRLVATFEDGEALFAAVCERELEGVVAQRVRDPYQLGERVWVKTKNRASARFAEERDGVGRRRRVLPGDDAARAPARTTSFGHNYSSFRVTDAQGSRTHGWKRRPALVIGHQRRPLHRP
jgi:hypothetical protein